MWQAMRASERTDAEFVSSATELVRNTLRNLIVATGLIYLVWHLVATVTWPGLGWRVWAISPVVGAICALSLLLLPKRLLLAQVVWYVGLALGITLAAYVFHQPRVALFYALLPLMAAVTLGWPAGLAMEGMVAGISWWLTRAQGLPAGLALEVVIGGAITGILGWAASDALLTVTEWSISAFNQSRQSTDEARQHRALLARVLKDLDQAYYRLQRANSALVAAWKTADEAERFKAEFATHLSHELRTPLNLIIGFADIMVTSPESYGGAQIPGPYRADLEAIYHSAQHLLALVDDVLDLARIEVHKIALARDEVDLASLVAEVTDMVRDYIAAKGVDFRVRVQESLPRLWVDRLRIRQVFLNLLVNAARFTEQGYIAVDVSQQGEEVVVHVTDTGKGIPEDTLPRIFEEFRSTSQSSTGWHSGAGLGLPISKKLVELHHGRMGVESAYLHGTSFWFTLPCAQGAALEPETGELTRKEPFGRLGASERIVIVVHGDPGIPRLLQRYLDGYRVIGAQNAEEGVALAREMRAIALVSGAGEPLTAAYEGLVTVRCDLPSSRQVAHELGAAELLVKPISREELYAALDRLGRPVHRVLIADDDPEMVRLLQRMLHGRIPASACLEAYTGAEVLSLARSGKPDLLLLDLFMPEMNGPEVLEEMSADPDLAQTPVIIISGRAQDRISMRLPGPIQVCKTEGLELGEAVQALGALFGALAPGWH